MNMQANYQRNPHLKRHFLIFGKIGLRDPTILQSWSVYGGGITWVDSVKRGEAPFAPVLLPQSITLHCWLELLGVALVLVIEH